MRVPRRVVTGVRQGRSVVLSDADTPNCHIYQGVPGFMTSVIWKTAGAPTLPIGDEEPAQPQTRIVPAPGHTTLMIVTFPPDSVFAAPGFSAELADAEQAAHLPGLAERFEKDDPAMHATESVDYDVVIDGEIWLELDDGVEVYLRQGDVVVQGGARHAWRNKGGSPATMAFLLIGAA